MPSLEAIANPRFWLAASVLLNVTAVECLLALWAATAPAKSRLQRVVVVWLAIVLLLPIKAEVPALVFTLIAAMTISIVSTTRFLTRERAGGESRWSGWHRFSLGDLFVATLLVGTLLGISLRIPYHWAILGVAPVAWPVAMVISLSYFAVQGRNRRRTAVFLVAALITFAVLGRAAWRLPFFPVIPSGSQEPEWGDLSQHELLLGSLIMLAYLATLLGHSTWKSQPWSYDAWRPRAWRVALAVATTLLALLVWYLQSVMTWRFDVEVRRLQHLAWAALPLTLLAVTVVGATAIANLARNGPFPTWQRAARIIAFAVPMVVGLALAWLYWQMLGTRPFPPFPSDAPTHYDRLVAIAKQVQREKQLLNSRRLPAPAQPIIDEASQLLKEPNYIPVSALERESHRAPSESVFNYDDLFAITDVFRIAADDAIVARQHDRAADRAIDMLRLGSMLQRGGIGGHRQMGTYAQQSAIQVLRKSGRIISADKRRDAIRALEEAIQLREDAPTQLIREQAYHERLRGWEGRLSGVIASVIPLDQAKSAAASDPGILNDLALRGAQLRLALISCEKTTGRRPTRLADLVPDFLPSVPIDPYSQQPLLVRQSTVGEWIPYSVGHDGVDNGGNFDPDPPMYANETGYDLKLPVD
jgi:hypothetical protein